jgi:cell division protein FtsW
MISSSARKVKTNFDWQFALLILILTFLGIVFIADASAPQAIRHFDDRFYFLKQQAVWAGIGIFLFFVISKINYRFWFYISPYLFALSLFFLVLVIIPQFGSKALGARRWLDFGPFGFQPSEFVKFALILYFSRLAELKKGIFSFAIPLFLVAFLIMLQPDLGTTLLIISIGIVQIFVSGVSFLNIFLLVFSSSFLGFLLILFSDYRRARLMTFLKQTSDPLGKDYHISQVLISLGLGGLWGVGLGESKQKYLFLPEAATDSIFAVIAEEVGFVGSLFFISLFVYLVYRGLRIALLARDDFSKMAVVGFVVWVGSQVILNLGSMTALTPLTGVPLPFISYGGSSLLTLLVSAGIILNISRSIKTENFYRRKVVRSNFRR